ncbi:MAG: hypothetical protein Q4E67_05055 [Planctomycetia bacterium]|nr:hypothetical protein [Planctomycetia bacterium]
MRRKQILATLLWITILGNMAWAEEVAEKIQQGWDVTWSRFYHPKTSQFYDFLGNYEVGRELDYLPTAREVQEQFPNVCGYGTGMEDCMISAGVLLSAVVDRYEVTREDSLKEEARKILRGIQLSATVHGSPGFLARGVCPEDGKSTYVNTSRDQYTHVVHALWHYYHSPLAEEAEKEAVRELLQSFADRMIRNCTPENDYDFLCSDGNRCRRGICKMWNVRGHEAARLPMFYAAAWDTLKTVDPKKADVYYQLYRQYLPEAVRQSLALDDATIRRWVPTYAMLQMQSSLELLWTLEPEGELRDQMFQAMKRMAEKAHAKLRAADNTAKTLDLTQLPTDWRLPDGGISNGNGYRRVWYNVRESGEAALTILMFPGTEWTPELENYLNQAILRVDFERVSTCGIFDLLGAYYRALKKCR